MTLFSKLVSHDAIPPHKIQIPVTSPVNGRIVELAQFPALIVQQRLLGEGVCIQPAGYQFVAPVDGIIERLPATGHYIKLRSAKGLRFHILLGWQTEQLMGEGFRLKKRQGEPVMQGDVILEFDLPKLKRVCDPPLFAFMLSNSDKTKAMTTTFQQVLANQDTILNLYF